MCTNEQPKIIFPLSASDRQPAVSPVYVIFVCLTCRLQHRSYNAQEEMKTVAFNVACHLLVQTTMISREKLSHITFSAPKTRCCVAPAWPDALCQSGSRKPNHGSKARLLLRHRGVSGATSRIIPLKNGPCISLRIQTSKPSNTEKTL